MQTVKDVKEILAQNLKSLRAYHRLTQEQLAEKSGLSQQTINNIECSRFVPKISNIVKLCNVLNVTVSEIFTTPGFYPHQREELIRASELHEIKEQINGILDSEMKKINPNANYNLKHNN